MACVVFHRGEIERHAWLVNPGRLINPEAQAVHHISDDDVKDAPSFAQIAERLLAVLARGIPLAYNADFDRAFLMAEFAAAQVMPALPPPALRKGVDWFDPLSGRANCSKGRKAVRYRRSRSVSASRSAKPTGLRMMRSPQGECCSRS